MIAAASYLLLRAASTVNANAELTHVLTCD